MPADAIKMYEEMTATLVEFTPRVNPEIGAVRWVPMLDDCERTWT